MPKFSYVAMDSRGKETKGTLDVNTQSEAIGRLKEMGYFPTKVVEIDKGKKEKQEKNVTLKDIIGKLALSIEGGSTFSEGLAQHPKVFNKLYVNMVKAGELGGVLEVVLKRLSEFMEKAQKIKGKVIAAMFYPSAVIIVAVVILAILMIWVVPKFKDIFKDMLPGEKLPGS